jgi:hypothetical protein
VLYQILKAGESLVSSDGASAISVAHNPGGALGDLSGKMAPIFLDPTGPVGKYVIANIATLMALRCVPFIGIALAIVNAAVASSQLAQTIDAVMQSPFVYETDLTRSFDLTVQLTPDHRSNLFPEYHDELEVKVVYDGNATLPIYRRSLDARPKSLPIFVRFVSIPAGGKLRVFATFRAYNGWASGQGASGWVPAHQDQGQARVVPPIEITTNEIPLNTSSVYQHRSRTGVNNQGQVDWIEAVGQPPATTVTTMSPSLLKLCDLTLAQLPETVCAGRPRESSSRRTIRPRRRPARRCSSCRTSPSPNSRGVRSRVRRSASACSRGSSTTSPRRTTAAARTSTSIHRIRSRTRTIPTAASTSATSS